jgi:hypothetical protein
MRRPMLTVVGILILVMGQGYALADTKTVMIGRRDGGQLLTHIHEGIEMIRKGYSYRIIGDQYSAAAMQLLYIESRKPTRLCAARKVRLYFHLGKNPRTGPTKKLDWLSTEFIGRANLRRLGKLPVYGHGFKTVKASDYIGLCRSKTISCNVRWCGL